MGLYLEKRLFLSGKGYILQQTKYNVNDLYDRNFLTDIIQGSNGAIEFLGFGLNGIAYIIFYLNQFVIGTYFLIFQFSHPKKCPYFGLLYSTFYVCKTFILYFLFHFLFKIYH